MHEIHVLLAFPFQFNPVSAGLNQFLPAGQDLLFLPVEITTLGTWAGHHTPYFFSCNDNIFAHNK